MNNKIYIVMGESENVYQDEIGGTFNKHPSQEVVKVFSLEKKAQLYIENAKLNKPKTRPFGDTSYYRGGYFEMYIEETFIE